MRYLGKNTHTKRAAPWDLSLRLGALAVALTALTLLAASSATAASFETVRHFGGVLTKPSKPGNFPEEVQLGNVSALAVNTTGAGGVAPGSIYAIDREINTGTHVLRFGPSGSFEEAWYLFEGKRCGPATEEPANPGVYTHCPAYAGGGNFDFLDVEVDQATGNVYVLDRGVINQHFVPVVRVYNPDGTELIAEFGEADTEWTIAESPGKLHRTTKGGLAVNDAGDVRIFDEDKDFHYRLMEFHPETPGDYHNYVYAGLGNDIAAGALSSKATPRPEEPVFDQAGKLYGHASENEIVEYSPAQPSTPICTFSVPAGGITAQTVNPVTGEPFYYSYKDRKVHRLRCNGEGKFAEVSAFGVSPERGALQAMTMDGGSKYTPGRPAGVLYGATPEERPSTGSGGEVGAGPLGYILAPAEETPPEVVSESVANVTTTTATLHAQISPRGSLTRYVFQFISEAAYEANESSDRFAGASEAPLGGAELGEGQRTLSAGVGLSGLAPDTAYRYRVVATSHCAPAEEAKVCETAGADEAFRTYPAEAPGLSDSRAWELVSPAQKNGGQVIPSAPNIASCGGGCKPGVVAGRFPQQSAPDGESIAYMGFPFSFTEGAVNFNEYISRRTSSGWGTTTLSPELMRPSGQGYVAFDAALNRGLLSQREVMLTSDAPGDYSNLYGQPTHNPAALSVLLSTAPPNRLPDSGETGFNLSYAGASADLSRVFFEANDALTEATPFAPEAVDGGAKKNNLYEWSEEGLRLVNVAPGNTATNPGAVFGSGIELAAASDARANFSHAISADGSRAFWSSESGQVYLRENGETTREISDHTGKFLTASADGSKLLLNDGRLFELDNGEAMVDLTEGKGGFEGIAGQSEDLSHIYFVDIKVLDETPNDHGDVAQEGKDNLYAWQEGTVRFVANLLPGDGVVGTGRGGIWSPSPVQRSAEASPNGRWLAFLSEGKPTHYDNTGACEFDNTQQKYVPSRSCPEAYLYDSVTGKLRCTSCNPSGEAPLGPTNLRLTYGAPGFLPQPRYLTDSGRLYFDTQDSLSVFDTNEGVEDVYQYEPEGVGSCKREGGCVSLISAGHEGVDSNFVTMDESGKNVFFTTRDELTLKDKDDLIDLYDAREGGGIPAESEVARSECQGEACQPLYSAPNDPTPGSSTFEGAGNVNEPKAAKKHKKRHAKKKHAHKRAAKRNRGGVK